MRRLLFFSLLFVLCLFACEKEELSTTSDARLPVVQGYLTANTVPEIQIFRQLPFGATTTELLPITGLSPQLMVEGTVYPLRQQPEGTYRADSSLLVRAGQQYQLLFEYEEREVSATTQIPEAPRNFSRSQAVLDLEDFPFSSTDPLTLRWDNPENDFHQVLLEYAETDTLEISLFAGRAEGDGPGMTLQPQQTNSFDVRPFSTRYAGSYRAILYRVTADYAVFAEDAGGASTNLTSPFTNVENGLGIFTGIAADTLTFEVRE